MTQNTITRALMTSIYSNAKFVDTFWNLCWRWTDECGYEDINMYKAPIASALKSLFGIEADIKMTKRPFGFTFTSPFEFTSKTGNKVVLPAKIQMHMYATGKMSWKAEPIKKK